MMCYRDMTFCPFWKECAVCCKCDRALTEEIQTYQQMADRWWGKGKDKAPICIFSEKPECFEVKK